MKRSLTVAASAALLFGVAALPAWASDTLPGADTALVEVVVPNQAAVDKVVANYDAAEYKRVEDDGSIMLNVEADASELAALRASGYKIGRTIEDAKHRAAVNAEREATAALEALAADLAKNGVPTWRHQARGQVGRADPGRDRHPARQQVHQLRRHVHLRRGAQQGDRAHHPRRQHVHRPDAGDVVRRSPTASTARPPTWPASSTPTRRPTSTCTTGSSSAFRPRRPPSRPRR